MENNRYPPVKAVTFLIVFISVFISSAEFIKPIINIIFFPLILIESVLIIFLIIKILKKNNEDITKNSLLSKITFYLLVPTLASLFIYFLIDSEEIKAFPNGIMPKSSFKLNPVENDPDGSILDIGYGIMYCNELPYLTYSTLNYSKAYDHFKRAEYKKNTSSYRYIGNLYYNGFGVEMNYNIAAFYYQLGCEAKDAESCKCLSDLYKEREWQNYNEEKSIEYLEISTQYGDMSSFYNQAVESLRKNDNSTAIKLFEKAAEKGHVESIYRLAILSQDTVTLKNNVNKKWIDKLIQKDDARGYYLKALFSTNVDETLNNLTKSAEMNYTTAQIELAKIYAGVSGLMIYYKNKPPDIDKAIFYCNKASINLNNQADSLMVILKQMKVNQDY